MNFRWTTWGVGLLGVLAFSGCSGDDTPTPGPDGSSSPTTGAGGAGNDASVVNETSTGKSGASVSDSGGDGAMCKITAAMTVSGQDLMSCRAGLDAGLGEGGADSGGAAAAASCFACLCTKCPKEAMTCIGDPNCKMISDCCRAACNCPTATPEGGADATASDATDSGSTVLDAAGDGATE